MAMIPASQPDAGWWMEQSKRYLMIHLTRPTPETLRTLWDLCEQYRAAVQGGFVQPLQFLGTI